MGQEGITERWAFLAPYSLMSFNPHLVRPPFVTARSISWHLFKSWDKLSGKWKTAAVWVTGSWFLRFFLTWYSLEYEASISGSLESGRRWLQNQRSLLILMQWGLKRALQQIPEVFSLEIRWGHLLSVSENPRRLTALESWKQPWRPSVTREETKGQRGKMTFPWSTASQAVSLDPL